MPFPLESRLGCTIVDGLESTGESWVGVKQAEGLLGARRNPSSNPSLPTSLSPPSLLPSLPVFLPPSFPPAFPPSLPLTSPTCCLWKPFWPSHVDRTQKCKPKGHLGSPGFHASTWRPQGTGLHHPDSSLPFLHACHTSQSSGRCTPRATWAPSCLPTSMQQHGNHRGLE